jgi:hypothetical protein
VEVCDDEGVWKGGEGERSERDGERKRKWRENKETKRTPPPNSLNHQPTHPIPNHSSRTTIDPAAEGEEVSLGFGAAEVVPEPAGWAEAGVSEANPNEGGGEGRQE